MELKIRKTPGFIHLMGWRVYGGPFRGAPMTGTYNVNLQHEIVAGNSPVHYRLKIVDFEIPGIYETAITLAMIIFQSKIMKRKVYVGCMGGIGRTGMIMALLVRVAYRSNGKDAISFVRGRFNEHAVETPEQKKFVSEFPIGNLRRWLALCRFIGGLTIPKDDATLSE